MTCQHARSLLEDYVDGEITGSDAEQLEHHLETCSNCRAEYESSLHIKSILSNQLIREPSNQYWDDVTQLILARTVEAEYVPEERPAIEDGREYQKTRFVRRYFWRHPWPSCTRPFPSALGIRSRGQSGHRSGGHFSSRRQFKG
jgi:anti-sigma factor (TIGR02949 family)